MTTLYIDTHPLVSDARPGKGTLPARFIFVGIAPSPNRPKGRENEPFGAASYKLLSRIIEAAPDSVYVTNLVKVPLAPTKKPGVRLIREYYPGLIQELKDVLAPNGRILVLGAAVAQVLCPGFDSMREDHGTFFFNPELKALVVPTYHFSAISRDPSKKRLLGRDLERFFELPDPQAPEIRDGVFIGAAEDMTVLDIETTGFDPDKDTVLAIGTAGLGGPAHQLRNPTLEQMKEFQAQVQESGTTIVGHNLAFDLAFIARKTGTHFLQNPVHDTMIDAFVAGERVLALKHLTTTYTDRPGSRAFGGPEDPAYLAEDLYSTREVLTHFGRGPHMPAQALLNDILPLVIKMRADGVTIDLDLLPEVTKEYKARRDAVLQILEEKAPEGINWSSVQQVRDFLLTQGVKLTETTAAGAFSIKETVLKDLASQYPVAGEILAFREAEKQLEFLESYGELTASSSDHRLHPRLILTSTETGRPSCREPNLQQVTRTGRLKTLFVSRWKKEGGLIGLVDLSQAELRVAAFVSDDHAFAKVLLSEDPHRANAAICFRKPEEEVTAVERKKSKGITFGLLYGGSPAGLAKKTLLPVSQVETILHEFYEAQFPDLMQWLDDTKMKGTSELKVMTPFGRVRDLSGVYFAEGERGVERKAVNTPIQSCASDINLCVYNAIGWGLYNGGLESIVQMTIHDSILLDVHPEEVSQVQYIVKEAFRLLSDWEPLRAFPLWGKLPVTGELLFGKSWAAVESTNENYAPIKELTTPCSSHPEVLTPKVQEKSDPNGHRQELLDLEALWDADESWEGPEDE